jgi:hypothetical protein
LEQTSVVLLEKYMDLLHLDDSNLWGILFDIEFTIFKIINKRNCD